MNKYYKILNLKLYGELLLDTNTSKIELLESGEILDKKFLNDIKK